MTRILQQTLRYGVVLTLGVGAASCSTVGTANPAPMDEAAPEPQAAAEPAEPISNTLRWSTASEVDNFGFDVYRGDSEDGPFERITETPLAGAGTIDTPSEYEFVDTTIEPGREYFYYVESISLAGVREQFTPIIRAKPKIVESQTQPEAAAGTGPDGRR